MLLCREGVRWRRHNHTRLGSPPCRAEITTHAATEPGPLRLASPNLTDFVLLTWALLIPTILMLAWYHGAPGRDRWTTAERLGIPLNVAIAAVVLFVVFRGADLGAATTAVAVETEEGETVERVVPKSEFRKHIALFFFDNENS